MASGTADLQRDLGGAIMQSIFGALLTAGYASAASTLVAESGKHISNSVENQLTKSFDGAQAIAQQYPHYSTQIEAAAKTAFLHGDQWAYVAGIVAVLLGGVLVFFCFPTMERERQLLAEYQSQDAAAPPLKAAPPTAPSTA
jgi:MFS transporter, DHA2 family, multidrug resistance protein